jgi:hypothetical protein
LNIADGDRPDKIGSYNLKKSHKRERETPVNDGRLTGMLDSQVRVIADKQVAQITADGKAIATSSASWKYCA